MGRSSSGSERMVQIIDQSSLNSEDIDSEMVTQNEVIQVQSSAEPTTTSFNVSKSSHVHIGAKYVSVTQNVEQMDVVNDLTFYRYILHILKKTTKTERIICGTAVLILILCIVLIVYFAVKAKSVENEVVTLEPSEWYIKRKEWLPRLRVYNDTEEFDKPVPLVIISHTVGSNCYTFVDCGGIMRNLQNYFIDNYDYDIPYNFLIGNDGRVYEGRGWKIVGAHTHGYNYCSIGIAFVGDYREGLPSYTKVTELQIERAHMLFEEGVKQGYLRINFRVLGAKDLVATLSPGTNLYKAIQGWVNYDHHSLFIGHSCKQILEISEKENIGSTTIKPANKNVT